MSVFDDVLRFMQIGHPEKLSNAPRIPPEEVKQLCRTLVKEEYEAELLKAIDEDNLVEIADACGDAIWVIICLAQCYGIPLAEVWSEIARTNMAKFPDGVVLRRPEDDKILKPPGWKPPDIARILNEAQPCVNGCGDKRSGMGTTCGHSYCVEEEHGEK